MLKLSLAQIQPTIGDIDGNVALHLAAARQARDAGAALVVFPELSLTGYSPGDLLNEPAFMAQVEQGLRDMLLATRETPGLHWVVGVPEVNTGAGRPLHNALLVLLDGKVVRRYAKQLLPSYDVFNEARHFEPGPDRACVLRIGAVQVGLLVCEDTWNSAGSAYTVDPFRRMADAQPDLVVAINASPSDVGKRALRREVLAHATLTHGLPLVYVNQVGGHDGLVFDGGSFVMDALGHVRFEAKRFAHDLVTLQFDPATRQFAAAQGAELVAPSITGLSKPAFQEAQIVRGLRDYARTCGFRTAVVGSSGGIDSALVIALAVKALGAANVVAITMPSVYSSRGSVDDSVALCQGLGVRLIEMPIQPLVDSVQAQWESAQGGPLQGVALENLQARIRANLLMAYSNTHGSLLLSTGNKSETSVGYTTLYGDASGGLAPIADLYKTEVTALCRHLNASVSASVIPQAIIDKPPSAELAPNQLDSQSLPPYPVLDKILMLLMEGDRLANDEQKAVRQQVEALLCDEPGVQTLMRVRRLFVRAEYKRHQAPPIIRLRARAFGAGRRVPIAAVHPGLDNPDSTRAAFRAMLAALGGRSGGALP